jgi:glyoxylase-like metal-dependent hydrolase (beta-lactamase superfamily II)
MKQKWKVKVFEWGSFSLDGGAMFGIIPKTLWSNKVAPDESNRIPLSLRSLYLENDEDKVLIDLGMGNDWSEKSQNIYNLKTLSLEEILHQNLSIKPIDITHVFLSHLHFDHCGFLTLKDLSGYRRSSFLNAEIFITSENFKNAQNPHVRESASYLPEIWQDPLNKGQFTLIDCQWLEFREILPGISIRRVDGHTKGQSIIYVDGVDGDYIFLADLCPTEHHVRDVWTMGYDLNPELSIKEKKIIFSEEETLKRNLVLQHSRTQSILNLKNSGSPKSLDILKTQTSITQGPQV